MAERIRYRDRIDHKIIFVLISLIIFGLVMVFSVASSQDDMSLFLKQLGCMSGGLLLMYAIHFLKVDYIRPWMIILLYIAACGTIAMLKLPEPFTKEVNGATRWLNLGFVRFQVAEFVKLAVILVLALWVEYTKYRKTWKEELLFILLGWVFGMAPALALMVISNDLSSAMVIAGMTFVMTFVACRGKMGWFLHILAAAAVVAFVAYYVWKVKNNMPTEEEVIAGTVKFRIGRIAAWIAPERYAKYIGFQPLHCLYAIANGGWIGKGLGQSWQKGILPESENDVIFAIIVEELGILGGFLLIFLFGVLITMMCKVAYNVEEVFQKAIIVGVVSHIMLQVMIHCSVCINLIPNTGIGLPFISSGMTQSLFQLMEMAMVLSISRVYIKELYEKKKKQRKRKRKLTLARNNAARSGRTTQSATTVSPMPRREGNENSSRSSQRVGTYSSRSSQRAGTYSSRSSQRAGTYSSRSSQRAGTYSSRSSQRAGTYSSRNSQYTGVYGTNRQNAVRYGDSRYGSNYIRSSDRVSSSDHKVTEFKTRNQKNRNNRK